MSAIIEWFSNSGNAAFAALVVAVASLIVAVISLSKSSKTQKRQLEIEEQRERDRVVRGKKASLVARIVRQPAPPGRISSVPDYFLEVENLGLGAARDISVTLDGGPLFSHPVVMKAEEVKRVGPQSSFRYMMAPSMKQRLPQQVAISWADDSGEPGKYETTLT